MGVILLILSVVIYFLLVWSVGNFGKNTSIGINGSIALAVITTPLVAFFILVIFYKREKVKLSKMYRHFPKKVDG